MAALDPLEDTESKERAIVFYHLLWYHTFATFFTFAGRSLVTICLSQRSVMRIVKDSGEE